MSNKPVVEVTASGSFEGTPKDAAFHIFHALILPLTEQLKSSNPKDAQEFVYHIMGLGITQYSETVCPDHFRKILNDIVEKLAFEMEKDQPGLKS